MQGLKAAWSTRDERPSIFTRTDKACQDDLSFSEFLSSRNGRPRPPPDAAFLYRRAEGYVNMDGETGELAVHGLPTTYELPEVDWENVGADQLWRPASAVALPSGVKGVSIGAGVGLTRKVTRKRSSEHNMRQTQSFTDLTDVDLLHGRNNGKGGVDMDIRLLRPSPRLQAAAGSSRGPRDTPLDSPVSSPAPTPSPLPSLLDVDKTGGASRSGSSLGLGAGIRVSTPVSMRSASAATPSRTASRGGVDKSGRLSLDRVASGNTSPSTGRSMPLEEKERCERERMRVEGQGMTRMVDPIMLGPRPGVGRSKSDSDTPGVVDLPEYPAFVQAQAQAQTQAKRGQTSDRGQAVIAVPFPAASADVYGRRMSVQAHFGGETLSARRESERERERESERERERVRIVLGAGSGGPGGGSGGGGVAGAGRVRGVTGSGAQLIDRPRDRDGRDRHHLHHNGDRRARGGDRELLALPDDVVRRFQELNAQL